jgi:hypothetical protein
MQANVVLMVVSTHGVPFIGCDSFCAWGCGGHLMKTTNPLQSEKRKCKVECVQEIDCNVFGSYDRT